MRNTKVVDLIGGLVRYGIEVDVVDPVVNQQEAKLEYELSVQAELPVSRRYGAVVVAVAHQQFVALSHEDWRQLLTPSGLILDIKGIVPRELEPLRF